MDDEPNTSSVVPTSLDNVNNQPDPSIKLPPIVLSGVLNNNGGLEYDPQGVPFFKFPPFVTTTIASGSAPATPLVSFSAFKPHGIQIMLDLEEDEVDGIGIRTVQLGVKHLPGGKDGKKKRKARKKLDVTFEKKVMWWEDWEEGESLRKGELLDINLPRIDRFSQGVADFQKNRRWTPTLQSVYDNFTQFVGLTGKTNPHIGKGFASAKKQAQQLEDDLMDGADDDEAEFANAIANDSTEPAGSAVAPVHSADETRIQELTAEYEAELERRELKLQAFLDDPELQTKIFFSSFYKNKGLFWSESKLNDGPILLRFFFRFFTRNGLMRDYDREFNKALKVIEKAIVELPLTTKISKEIPDDFGKACAGIWDKQSAEIIQKERSKVLAERQGDKDTAEPSNPEPPPDATSNTNSNTWADPFNSLSQNAPNPASWMPFEIPSQWGPPGSDTHIDESSNPNPIHQSEPDPWGPRLESTGWSLPPPPFLMSLIGGPVSIPLTHEVKLVEKSTRRIAGVEARDEEKKNHGVLSNMGTVILAPWDLTPNSVSQTDPNAQENLSGSILPPELHIIQPPPSPSSTTTDDPTNQTIIAYVSPSTCDILRNAIGMGLYAVFVKVGLRDDVKLQLKSQADSERPTKKKRKSSKPSSSNLDSADSEFWYIELLYEITPSFWTESDEGFEEGSDDGGV